MRAGTATRPKHFECFDPAVPRRLLSASELSGVLADAALRPVTLARGAAWRDVQLLSLTFPEGGELYVPPAAFYTIASFADAGGSSLELDSGGATSLDLAGAMVVVGPGQGMRLRWARPHSATWVSLEPSLLATAAAECGLDADDLALRARAVAADGVYGSLLAALAAEARQAAYPLQELIVESIATALAYRLVTRLARATPRAVSLPGALNMRAFRDVAAHIERHLDERISLSDLAGVAGVSRFHFARQFRLRTGESPMGYLLRVRIERGKQLLRETAASIGEVAAALAFADQSHFTRTFKRLVGVPPREYKAGGGPASRTRTAAPLHVSTTTIGDVA